MFKNVTYTKFVDEICLIYKEVFQIKHDRKIDLGRNKYAQTKPKHVETNQYEKK